MFVGKINAKMLPQSLHHNPLITSILVFAMYVIANLKQFTLSTIKGYKDALKGSFTQDD